MKPVIFIGRVDTDPWAWNVSNRRLVSVVLVSCLSIWLAGCATSADPHQGGFVSGVVGLAGGGYQRRIDEREGAYRDELDSQERLKAEARALELERAAVRSDLDRAKTRLAAQERSIAQARAGLKAQRQTSAQTQERLRQIDQAQAQATRTKNALGGVRVQDQPVTDLKTQAEDINKELDEIDSMVQGVSGTRF